MRREEVGLLSNYETPIDLPFRHALHILVNITMDTDMKRLMKMRSNRSPCNLPTSPSWGAYTVGLPGR